MSLRSYRGMRAITLLTFVAFALSACDAGLKSEADLRQQFFQSKEPILHILQMQRHDAKVIRIAPSFTRLENNWNWPRKDIGFNEERWNYYRELFRNAGIADGIQNEDGYIFYFVSSVGLAVSGTSRGFVFTPTPPENVVKSFEECPAGKHPCYVPLDGPWYLFTWST